MPHKEKSFIDQKREFVKTYVSEEVKKGAKITGVVYELSERFICHPRTVENWLYHKEKSGNNSY